MCETSIEKRGKMCYAVDCPKGKGGRADEAECHRGFKKVEDR